MLQVACKRGLLLEYTLSFLQRPTRRHLTERDDRGWCETLSDLLKPLKHSLLVGLNRKGEQTGCLSVLDLVNRPMSMENMRR